MNDDLRQALRDAQIEWDKQDAMTDAESDRLLKTVFHNSEFGFQAYMQARLLHHLSVILLIHSGAPVPKKIPEHMDHYAIGNTVCLGRYPGGVISNHPSHWEAVREMFRLNEAAGMDDRKEIPCEEYPDPRAYPLADNH